MRCVEINAAGVVMDVDPQPSDVSSCTLVLAVPAELQNDVMALTSTQGAEIGGAVLLVWAGAWVIRQVARALNVDGEPQA